MTMSEAQQPQLDKPGAGLPYVESLIVKYFVGKFVSKRDSWEELNRRFENVYREILESVRGVDAKDAVKKVLIKRIQGLEDSSRFWSIAMTVEHLLIVGEAMKKVVIELSHGRELAGEVKIADVKPKGSESWELLLPRFETFVSTALAEINSKVGDRRSQTTKFHPWFGPINAHQWFWLLSAHGRIHLRQIRLIKESLRG